MQPVDSDVELLMQQACDKLKVSSMGAGGALAASPRASAAACSPARRSSPAPPPVASPPVSIPCVRHAEHTRVNEAPRRTDISLKQQMGGCLQTRVQLGKL